MGTRLVVDGDLLATAVADLRGVSRVLEGLPGLLGDVDGALPAGGLRHAVDEAVRDWGDRRRHLLTRVEALRELAGTSLGTYAQVEDELVRALSGRAR
ncbi:hypothetical protein EV189_0693 [Motilibacter rhizosphaerae]|uniref:Excreted virulence factor EspC (Type VII ESX diderm) n=1 Tax=Motilibacter rhizosphaerae TaxID=598652 RepID=A0A4Q7NYH8_9ACTN|nr:hypothetical protein [Motilibacter rhizosphaerae]RZS91452.1 hypothetical protein EV189_0693 [Motilibacter rhizosphaerae]